MLRTVPPCTPAPAPIIVPAIPEVTTWVVDTGSPSWEVTSMTPLATVWAAKPETGESE